MNFDYFEIKGGIPLNGEVKVTGAKNAVTKIIVASMLSDKKCTLHNVPNISDVEITLELCKEIGMKVNWDKKKHKLSIQTKEIITRHIPQRFSGANRIPILLIGALLGRCREEIIIPTVGGCHIGQRPVDFHINSLEKLGAFIDYRKIGEDTVYVASAPKGLVGQIIELDYPSVGATENTILAACLAKGRTVIKNAAMECEILDLIHFLQKCGVSIYVDVDRTIHIDETKQFYPCEHTVITDRIVAASFGMAAIATKGRVFVKGANQEHMVTFLNHIREIGGGFSVEKDGIEFYYDKELKGGAHLETDVHPGFMTDWQQPFTILLTQGKHSSVVHETVYESRFGYVHTLIEMGADIDFFTKCLGRKPCRFALKNHAHSIVIKGNARLVAKDIMIPDLRAGFAYVMAALVAEGTSKISNLHFLDRGYEDLENKFKNLGAQIERKSSELVLI
ncbi:MAG: UDP-N-acetylglucosamine 1-carboxyvinyltransferase 1 [Chlamydiia bacterium]|nr:UDP-N-acetylglucosamine 1-carboxyvinyltransferase 1 [Chlamydiia bacterium]